MGCNTSKESVPQNEAEQNKENIGNKEQTEEVSNDVADTNDSKSASAKTITLRSNGTAKSIDEQPEQTNITENPLQEGQERRKDEATVGQHQSAAPPDSSQSADEESAATKIQAVFRGHQSRKSMKQPGKTNATAPEPEPTQEELEQEFRADDVELCHAATKIQASFRGHMSRKQQDKKDGEEGEGDSSSKGMGDQKLDDEELDIDLSDPDLNKAAVKIQASFRGHLVRKHDEDDEVHEN